MKYLNLVNKIFNYNEEFSEKEMDDKNGILFTILGITILLSIFFGILTYFSGDQFRSPNKYINMFTKNVAGISFIFSVVIGLLFFIPYINGIVASKDGDKNNFKEKVINQLKSDEFYINMECTFYFLAWTGAMYYYGVFNRNDSGKNPGQTAGQKVSIKKILFERLVFASWCTNLLFYTMYFAFCIYASAFYNQNQVNYLIAQTQILHAPRIITARLQYVIIIILAIYTNVTSSVNSFDKVRDALYAKTSSREKIVNFKASGNTSYKKVDWNNDWINTDGTFDTESIKKALEVRNTQIDDTSNAILAGKKYDPSFVLNPKYTQIPNMPNLGEKSRRYAIEEVIEVDKAK